MTTKAPSSAIGWVPSVYYADGFVKCRLELAWRVLLKYETWNPTFVGAQVTPIEGTASSEGELVLISKKLSEPAHDSFPEFYSETVKVVPGRRIVWYVFAKEGQTYQGQRDPFRNFVDFGLTEESGGIKFNIAYYAQNRLSGELLATERGYMPPALQQMVAAFRDHCEATK